MKQIQLSQGMVAVVDDDDFERLSGFRWFYRGERHENLGYAMRHGTKNGSNEDDLPAQGNSGRAAWPRGSVRQSRPARLQEAEPARGHQGRGHASTTGHGA